MIAINNFKRRVEKVAKYDRILDNFKKIVLGLITNTFILFLIKDS